MGNLTHRKEAALLPPHSTQGGYSDHPHLGWDAGPDGVRMLEVHQEVPAC